MKNRATDSRNVNPAWSRYQAKTGTKANMGLVASVSRSSGVERDGDALKNFKVQQEYRDFIQTKLDDYWKSYPEHTSDSNPMQRMNAQENLLIIFRKLREGVSSSGRADSFAIEVYETSLYLTIMFDSPRQMASIPAYLVSTLYPSVPQAPLLQSRRLLTILISLVYYLVSAYPSQSPFYERLHSIPSSFSPKDSPAHDWISSLTCSLRSRNYVRVSRLTHPSAFSHLICGSSHPPSHPNVDSAEKALYAIVEKLRAVSRDTAWSVIRSAYREFWFDVAEGETRDWLSRCLSLPCVVPGASDISAEEWIQKKISEGQVRDKGDAEGRYIVCKVR